jgi:hypothetical protein
VKKTVFVAAVVLASAVMTAPVALAQEEPADCAAAVTALNAADAAHRDAVDADRKLADAEDGDQALKDARRNLKDAEGKRDTAQAEVTRWEAELARLNEPRVSEEAAKNPAEPRKNGTPEQIAAAEKALDEANKTLRNRQDRVNDLVKAVERAEKGAKPEVTELRRKANQTDAGELQKALDAARDDFNRLCDGVTTTPPPADEAPDPINLDCADFPLADGRTSQQVLDSTPGEDPHGLDADGDRVACEAGEDTAPDGADRGDRTVELDSLDNVVVPEGGVATGGGPA